MKIREKFQEFYRFLTSPKVVKLSLNGALITFIGGIIVAVLIAQLDRAGDIEGGIPVLSPDPAGYNPLINYISDLGNEDLTPMPIILNWTLMNTSLLMISPSLYFWNILKGDGSKLIRKILAYITAVCMFIGMIGFFLNGVLSEDVGLVWDTIFPIGIEWHELTTTVNFGFLMASGILVASQIIIFPDILREKFRLEKSKIRLVRIFNVINSWIFTPVCFIFFNTVPYLWYTDAFWTFLPVWQWAPMWEWLLMISLTAWLISMSRLILKDLKHEMLK
ncbi:MAG: DUF998 domain-containing protein [Candidatus Hodarchaeota archaeon]